MTLRRNDRRVLPRKTHRRWHRIIRKIRFLLVGTGVAAAVLGFVALPVDAGGAPDMSDRQLRQLAAGDILVGVRHADAPSRGTVVATVLIDAPAERIWRVMNDCTEAPRFVPGLRDCRVLASGENWDVIRHDVKWVWLLPRITYVFRAEYENGRKIEFTGIDGDLREIEGSWRLTPVDGGSRTIVQYSVFLDPGFYVPQWLVRSALKADLPRVLAALRNEVTERGIRM